MTGLFPEEWEIVRKMSLTMSSLSIVRLATLWQIVVAGGRFLTTHELIP